VGRSLLARLTGRSDKEMPFLEHLEELRQVLLASLAALALCAIAGYAVSGWVMDYIVVHTVGQAQFLRPMEAFNVRFKLALILGAVVSLPFIAFQIWSFIVPGLMPSERRLVMPMVVASTVLFLGGLAFSYWILTPLMMRLLVGFGTSHVQPNIAVDYLLDFIIKLALGTGIMFQLPLVVVLLTMVRVVSPRFLWSKWRHAIVIILVIAAVVTPGDGALSTLVLAGPILVLYFLSALLSTLIVRGRRKKEMEEERGRSGGDGPGAGATDHESKPDRGEEGDSAP
jgi:sec-independent protein translocase protein TatC